MDLLHEIQYFRGSGSLLADGLIEVMKTKSFTLKYQIQVLIQTVKISPPTSGSTGQSSDSKCNQTLTSIIRKSQFSSRAATGQFVDKVIEEATLPTVHNKHNIGHSNHNTEG